jgi:hypothetical protein
MTAKTKLLFQMVAGLARVVLSVSSAAAQDYKG